jgi:hypothetical protein
MQVGYDLLEAPFRAIAVDPRRKATMPHMPPLAYVFSQ